MMACRVDMRTGLDRFPYDRPSIHVIRRSALVYGYPLSGRPVGDEQIVLFLVTSASWVSLWRPCRRFRGDIHVASMSSFSYRPPCRLPPVFDRAGTGHSVASRPSESIRLHPPVGLKLVAVPTVAIRYDPVYHNDSTRNIKIVDRHTVEFAPSICGLSVSSTDE